MIVTINTDASHHGEKQVGSYAFWIVCDDFKIMKAGVLRRKCHTAEIAEFRCIINAVHTLFFANPRKITKIVLNTDCLNVIHVLNQDKAAIKRYGLTGSWRSDLFKMFFSIVGDTKCEFRHVKAHTHTLTARNWVNDWCDKEAKKFMWEKVKSMK